MGKHRKYIYDWPRPMVTVDAAIFDFTQNRARLLLIKRAKEPFKNKWALPGGFVEMNEELIDAAARELTEETGLAGIKLEQLRAFGKVGRDPRGRNISVVFFGIAGPDQTRIKAADDAKEAKWFDISKLPPMGFDHDEVVRIAIKKLKRKRIYQQLCKEHM
jgi:8-oxo-dGTP diphosphatase